MPWTSLATEAVNPFEQRMADSVWRWAARTASFVFERRLAHFGGSARNSSAIRCVEWNPFHRIANIELPFAHWIAAGTDDGHILFFSIAADSEPASDEGARSRLVFRVKHSV